MARQPLPAADPEAMRALHDAWAGPLFVFALRSLGDREAAEEVVQDTLVRAWQHADRFDEDRGSVATWLFAIARNLVIDRHRRASARPRTDTDLADVTPPADPPEIDRVLEAWQIADGINRLSAAHREAIVATYYRGLSMDEAARQLDVPPGTVKSRVYYGLRALRLHLEEMGVVT